MGFLSLGVEKLAEGVGNAPTSAMPILFSRQVQPAYICLPSTQNGCQAWTRTRTSGLTNRRATLTPPGNGAAGRIPTCMVPFRRRMPHVFGHGSSLKMVSAAGLAPAIIRSQAGHVAATLRAVCPGAIRQGAGGLVLLKRTGFRPWTTARGKIWRSRWDLHPQSSRRQRVAFFYSATRAKWWEMLVTLQSSLPTDIL